MNHKIIDCAGRDCVQTATGVVIGRAHIPQQYGLHNPDTDAVQRALLQERARIDWDGIAIIAGVVVFLLCIGVAL